MHPAGHFVTTAVLGAGVYGGTRSSALTAGVIAGGFFIDVDHLFDYVTVNRQRDLSPRRFLDYYLNQKFQWVVLPLHSWELFAALVCVGAFAPHPLLTGYLIGAALHMTLDLIFNAGLSDSILAFYSFTYRARRRFDKRRLLRTDHPALDDAASG